MLLRKSANLLGAFALGLSMTTMSAFVSDLSVAEAADYKLRATANSNENDEDYDGLIVFKDYVEKASNGAIEVELFIASPTERSTSTSQPPAALPGSFPMCRCSTCLI